MSERKKVEVNEEVLQQMMAADNQSYLLGEVIKPAAKAPEVQEYEEIDTEPVSEPTKENHPFPDSDQQNKGLKKRKSQKSDFSELFLKERTVKNRKQIYISAETFDLIQSYLKHISDVSFIAYVDNILLQHVEEHKDAINELFKKVYSPFLN